MKITLFYHMFTHIKRITFWRNCITHTRCWDYNVLIWFETRAENGTLNVNRSWSRDKTGIGIKINAFSEGFIFCILVQRTNTWVMDYFGKNLIQNKFVFKYLHTYEIDSYNKSTILFWLKIMQISNGHIRSYKLKVKTGICHRISWSTMHINYITMSTTTCDPLHDDVIKRVTGPLCGKFTGDRWIPHTKANDAELWCFLWFVPE